VSRVTLRVGGRKNQRQRWLPNGYHTVKMIGYFSITLCLLLIYGCQGDVSTIWSKEARSPDGRWIAIARTIEHGGPGMAGIETYVSMQSTLTSSSSIRILEFSQDSKSLGLIMNWETPWQLNVTYTAPAEVNFQAVKCCGGVDISLRWIRSAGVAH